MTDTIILEYRLTKDLWRSFYEAHYAADKSLKWRYVWGVICIVIACSGFGGLYDSELVAGLLLATGFYGVLSKPIFLTRSMRSVEKHPFFGEELLVTISIEEIAVRSGQVGYSQPWSSFIGYRKVKPGYMFYLSRTAFFFVPMVAMTNEDRAWLEEVLKNLKIRYI